MAHDLPKRVDLRPGQNVDLSHITEKMWVAAVKAAKDAVSDQSITVFPPYEGACKVSLGEFKAAVGRLSKANGYDLDESLDGERFEQVKSKVFSYLERLGRLIADLDGRVAGEENSNV